MLTVNKFLPSLLMKRSKRKEGSSNKRVVTDLVLQALKASPTQPMNYKQLSAVLGIQDSGGRVLLMEVLEELKAAGLIKERERGKYLPAVLSATLVQGVLDINRFGRGFVRVDGVEDDIMLEKGKYGTALPGDVIELSLSGTARRPRVDFKRIVKRGREEYVGVFYDKGVYAEVKPVSKQMPIYFVIKEDGKSTAVNGDKVLVKIKQWTDAKRMPIAEVTKVFGQQGVHDVEMHAILAEFDLPYEFPDHVIAAANEIDPGFTPEEIAQRKDFRGVTTFTIDPFDAKEFEHA